MVMIWDDNKLQQKLLYKRSMRCDCSHASNINGDENIKEITMMLNQKNATLQLLQVNNNVSAQDRGTNFTLSA